MNDNPAAPRNGQWDLADILNPRDKKMSLDYYPQQQDHHSFDQMDTTGYSLFADSNSRYRTNASSSSSLGPAFPMNSEPIYSHASFADSSSFNPSNGYDIEKVSPESATNLHHPTGGFPPTKDYPPQSFGDVHERRLPGVGPNGGYPAEYSDDYAIGNINNNGLPFGPSAMQHFQDRLGRFPPDRYTHLSGPPSHHMPNGHSSDLMRGVAPHATHSFRENPVSPYDDIHYLGNGHPEMRMHTVDDTLARMKLQGHPIMGTSNDLQTFIR
jgi:hypothetical protein